MSAFVAKTIGAHLQVPTLIMAWQICLILSTKAMNNRWQKWALTLIGRCRSNLHHIRNHRTDNHRRNCHGYRSSHFFAHRKPPVVVFLSIRLSIRWLNWIGIPKKSPAWGSLLSPWNTTYYLGYILWGLVFRLLREERKVGPVTSCRLTPHQLRMWGPPETRSSSFSVICFCLAILISPVCRSWLTALSETIFWDIGKDVCARRHLF